MLLPLIRSIMKQKLILIATVFTIAFGMQNAHAQWERTNGPGAVNCFANNGGSLFVSKYGSGIFRSTDSGATWILIDSSLENITFNTLTAFAGYVFAGSTDYHGIFRSSDNGISWEADTTDIDSNRNAYSIAALGNTLFMWGDWRDNDPLSRSTDTGRTWVPSSCRGLGLNYQGAGAFSVMDTNLFLGAGYIYLSTDNGETWNVKSNGLVASTGSFATIGTYLFAASSVGVFRSSNSGDSWEAASKGLSDSDIINIAASGSNIFAVSPAAIYLSTDSGNSWVSVTTPEAPRSAYSVYAIDGYLFAGCYDSIWRRPLSDFNTSAVSPVASIENSLTTYPNPFTQSTTIAFTAPASGVAELSVVNLLGQEVARIFNGELSAGEHSFTWDAAKMVAPQGMYECIVRMNGRVQEIPIVLTR